jgi:hypothetical protein
MKHIISIGINNTDGLQPLGAAASGAEDFARWGTSQGYSTSLLIDDKGPISQVHIFDEINNIVNAKTCEKLIVFFSGHGILKSPCQEIWLLNNAKTNPNESVNLTESIEYARTTGIPYIVFISDACRVLPNELQFTGNGSVIFPICNDTGQDSFIDVLYATRPGSPAAEVSISKSSAKFGLFTQTIVEVLNGDYPELIKEQKGDSLSTYYDIKSLTVDPDYKDLTGGSWFINTINSEDSIKSILTEKASQISIKLGQNPDIRLQHQNPKPNLSEFDDSKAKNLLLSSQSKIKIKTSVDRIIVDSVQENLKIGIHPGALKNSSFKSILNGFDTIAGSVNMYNVKSALVRNSEIIFDAKGKRSFESRTGFTVIGAKIKEVLVNCSHQMEYEAGKEHIRIYKEDDTFSALIILSNGQSIPVAVLDGYVGTLVFEKKRLLTVNYTPSQNSPKYFYFERDENNIKFVRAFIAAAANEGFDYSKVFANEFGNDGHADYSNAGSYLRREKALDPSLGLYAVYAYMQQGKIRDIKSVYRYMRKEPENIIFDVAMLSDELINDFKKTASFCPVMALGWAYGRKFENWVHPLVLEASKSLVPSLWTTFDKRGTSIIKELFNQKEIR